jgi:hypothetical protein
MSLGSMIATAEINAHPADYSGVVLMEGMLYTSNSDIARPMRQFCEHLSSPEAPVFDGQNYPALKAIYMLSSTDPGGTSPVVPNLTNRQVYMAALTTPVDPPQGLVPGYTLAAGSLEGLTYASEETLGQFILQLNDYEPTALTRDYICGLAGERRYTHSLEKFDGKVLSFQAGRGFGTHARENLRLFARASSIGEVYEPNYAHADFFASPANIRLWAEKTLNWLAL